MPYKLIQFSLLCKGIKDILLVGHRQAFSWIDHWYGKYASLMSIKNGKFLRQAKP